MISPFFFPVTSETFNFVSNVVNPRRINGSFSVQACVIFGSVTILGIISWWFTPEDRWLRRDILIKGFENSDIPEAQTVPIRARDD